MTTAVEVILAGEVEVKSPTQQAKPGKKNGTLWDKYKVELTYSPQSRGFIQRDHFVDALASYKKDVWPPEQLAYQMAEAFSNIVQSDVKIRLRSAKGDPPLIRVHAHAIPEVKVEQGAALKGHQGGR